MMMTVRLTFERTCNTIGKSVVSNSPLINATFARDSSILRTAIRANRTARVGVGTNRSVGHLLLLLSSFGFT